MHARDKQVLDVLIDLHAVKSPRILDVTFNRGVMWKGSGYVPTRMDIDPRFEIDVVADFRTIPFEDESWDVIVFDPPHLPVAAASPCSSRIFEDRYGITPIGSPGGRIVSDNVSS